MQRSMYGNRILLRQLKDQAVRRSERVANRMIPSNNHHGAAVASFLSDAQFTMGETHKRSLVSVTHPLKGPKSSPFDKNPNADKAVPSNKRLRKKREFIPRKAAVQLTDQARNYFKVLLENPPRPQIIGVMLSYHQSKTGEPRMVFAFDFVTEHDIGPDDEGVSLEVLPDGTPKPPAESMHDGLPKLYVNHDAFLKVLGATVDVDMESVAPILYDREGNLMDPNA